MDIRWYKGKYKVQIVKKSRMNYLIEVLEDVFQSGFMVWQIGDKFTTVPRLLWRNKRK